jgi:hypothetical protein
MIKKTKYFGILFAVITSALLTACTYTTINPEAALTDIHANNGYNELRDIEPGTAKLIVRSAGSAFPAAFSVSTSPQACRDFVSLGSVAYTGRGIVYPWIANFLQRGVRKHPYLVHEATPGEPIQVRGYGSWADGKDAGFRSGNCGPVTLAFTPREGHVYTIDFVWGSGKPACRLVLMDATDRDAPAPVSESQAVDGCPAPAS